MFEQNIFGSFISIVFLVLGIKLSRREAREIDSEITKTKDYAPALGLMIYMGAVVLLYSLSFLPNLFMFFSLLSLGIAIVVWPFISIVMTGYKTKAKFSSNGFTHWDKNLVISVITYETIFSIFHAIESLIKMSKFFYSLKITHHIFHY